MRRQIKPMAVTTGWGMLLGVMLLQGLLATPAQAQVNVNVNIGAPRPVVVHAPPTMLFLPEPGIYVAAGVPYDIFFVSDRYYYLHGGSWFWAPGYGGPWVHVVHTTLPPGLRKFKVQRLREFREREYTVYKVQGPKFKGKHFEAVKEREHKEKEWEHKEKERGHKEKGRGHGGKKGKKG